MPPADPPAESPDLPLYQRLAQELRGAIERGVHPVGSTLPTEAELCQHHGVSRHTVREALRLLVDLGLIERRQGAGSRVLATVPPVAYVHTIRSLTELFSYTRDTRLEVAASETVALDEAEAEALRWPAGTRWLRMTGLRWTADGREKVCHVTLYVHARFAALLGDAGRQDGPIYALVEARSGERVAEALQEVSAAPLPAAAARALDARPGAPALRIVRRYLDASGGPMLVAVNWHRAGDFTYSIRLRRDDEGG